MKISSLSNQDFEQLQALQRRFPVPAGWTLKDSVFNFSAEQWSKVAEAQRSDTESTFHKVSVSEMYLALTGGDCSSLAKNRVKSWSSKLFAIVPPGGVSPVLFVPQTLTRSDSNVFGSQEWNGELFDHEDAGAVSNLVLLVQDSLDIRISSIDPLEDEEPPCLRQDIMLLFHEWDAHLTPADMFRSIIEVGWWPSLKRDVYHHWRYCSLCMGKRSAKRLAGLGTIFRVRHRHISGDHVILPSWLSQILGLAALFVVVDLASGEFDVFKCVSTGAREACSWLFNGWVRYRGFFYTFQSDQRVAFTSQVTSIFMQMIGLKVHRFGATDDSRAQAYVESKNRMLREMEREISENAGVQSQEDLDFFITRYMVKHSMILKSGGSTTFERIRGEPAIQLSDLLTTTVDIERDLHALDTHEEGFLKAVADCTSSLMNEYKVHQEVRARDNAYTRDSNESSTRGYMQDFSPGQILSYRGKKVEVVSLDGWDGVTHMIAVVKEPGSDRTIKVKCQDLRERCWGRPQWKPMVPLGIALNNMVFCSPRESDYNHVGMAIELNDEYVLVHEYSTNPELRTRWRPMWESDDGALVCKRTCPSGFSAHVMRVQRPDVMMVGKMLKEVLTDDTKRRLLARGYFWALPVNTSGGASTG